MELFVRFAQEKMPFFLQPIGNEDAVFVFHPSTISNSTLEIDFQAMPFIARENSWTTLHGQAIALDEVTQYWPTNLKLKSNDTLTTSQDSYESYVAKSVEALNQGPLKKIVAARKVIINAVRPSAEVFQALCEQYPNANVFAWWNGDSCWMGASLNCC